MRTDPLSQDERERFADIFRRVPFIQFLGFELLNVDTGSAEIGATARPEFLQNHGVLHGGFTATLIDSATAFSIISHLAPGETTTTVDLNIHYLRPIVSGRLSATARVIRAGRRIITATAEVKDEAGRMCAMATTTYIRLTPETPVAAAVKLDE